MSLSELAFRIGRGIGKHPVAGLAFCLCERLLPLQRIGRTRELVAFHHPRPVADPHILIVPTRPCRSLVDSKWSTRRKSDLVWSMITFAEGIATDLDTGATWQFTINGGRRQDIGQLHGHLTIATDSADPNEVPITNPGIDSAPWNHLFTEIGIADTIPDNGYTLALTWNTSRKPTAVLWQELANV